MSGLTLINKLTLSRLAALLALLLALPALVPVHAATPQAATAREQTAVFAGGCFWGVDAVFKHVKGVIEAESGYAGGDPARTSYRQVSGGSTGHAEAVRVRFDPARVSYRQLLEVFFKVAHDPTQLNRQGPDVGTQYRSAIFYTNEEQRQQAQEQVRQYTEARTFPRPIVTQIAPLQQFHRAEDYHQNYLALHPTQAYIVIHDLPKLDKLRSSYPQLYQ